MSDAEYITKLERKWDRAWPALCIVAAAVESYDLNAWRGIELLLNECRELRRVRDEILQETTK